MPILGTFFSPTKKQKNKILNAAHYGKINLKKNTSEKNENYNILIIIIKIYGNTFNT